MKESLINFIAILQIVFGIFALGISLTEIDSALPGGQYFDWQIAIVAALPGILAVLLGLGILKKQIALFIINLLILPVIWFFVGFGFAFGYGFGGGPQPWWTPITLYGPIALWFLTLIALAARLQNRKNPKL